MKFDLFTQFGALNSPPIFESFKKGIISSGNTFDIGTKNGDVAVIWSVLWYGRMRPNKDVWNLYHSKNKPIIVLEVGCIERYKTWKIGVNGINLGSYDYSKNNDRKRFDQLRINLKPWNTSGSQILICGQHDQSHQWEGNPNMATWVERTASELKRYTERPLVFRPHPRSRVRTLSGITMSKEPDFINDINKSWAVVSWNSNPGIQAVLNGIPAFVGPQSLAAPVSNLSLSDIENPSRPDRQQWANDLAWSEWTQEEMELGIPQRLIASYLE